MELVENGISIDQPILELYIAKNLCVSYNSYFIQFTQESLRKVFGEWQMEIHRLKMSYLIYDKSKKTCNLYCN